ncbi:hypothetical protein A2Z33_03220 [Candidatus Gottesmanbacteria bacterium RBG_16_52_11]|uniref:Uncharacterized protein n=1 Tax=Candidatus Gottesmanbacteria bacterium RBG_16_52_11 TaxID=1798374 RepID=A0A1F5YVK4_9BACT|nr:MAG: hypothetical protein A2Z33_03220 [Candidatus Gottesmanbacteria bacterium RBG_16_52_11]
MINRGRRLSVLYQSGRVIHDTMNTMNDLPQIPQTDGSGGPSAVTPGSSPALSVPPVTGGGMQKEAEGAIHMGPIEAPTLTEVGKDIELPKEVAQSGVSIPPTTIPIPQILKSAGVAPQGANVTLPKPQPSSVPLTDDQIAQGLKKSVFDSWRWLAEWCTRKLKQLRLAGGQK